MSKVLYIVIHNCVCMYSTTYYVTTLSDRNSYQTQKKESYDSLRLIEAKSRDTYLIDVLWGQPIKLIQIVSTPEFHDY